MMTPARDIAERAVEIVLGILHSTGGDGAQSAAAAIEEHRHTIVEAAAAVAGERPDPGILVDGALRAIAKLLDSLGLGTLAPWLGSLGPWLLASVTGAFERPLRGASISVKADLT